MRTLVIGIPLPDASFDNYSFASAPSISEYRRLVVEMSAVTRVVDEIAHAGTEHRTFGGQIVVNRPSTGVTFSLVDMITMRRREADQFFARGGTAICFAYPDTTILGIDGLTKWCSYDWLPSAERFDYRTALLPGFGKDAAQPIGVDHPLSAYFDEFAANSRYRAHAEDATVTEAGGVVLARSAGGVALAFDIPVSAGRIIFMPPLLDPAKDRQQIAGALLKAFNALPATNPTAEAIPQTAEIPDWIRKEVP